MLEVGLSAPRPPDLDGPRGEVTGAEGHLGASRAHRADG